MMQPTGTECAPNGRPEGLEAARAPRDWAWPAVVGAAVAADLLWVFWPSLGGMAGRWMHDARYSHGVLVPLFAASLLWLRRDRLAGVRPSASWWGVPLVALGAALHVAGAYLYFDLIDEAALLPALAGLCLVVGGWPALRWAWPSIGFLVFMFPLPYRVEIALSLPLQRLATIASTYALQTLGFPALSEGNVIVLDRVEIGVVEACNGLGMLVSFFAMSTAVALLLARPWLDRLVIVASAVPVALLANVGRITVTGVLHETVGSRLANIVFHDLAGWLMMPVALGLLGLEIAFLTRLFVETEPARPRPLRLDPTATPRRRLEAGGRAGRD